MGGPLLRSTFIHLPGIGPGTESALWRQGIDRLVRSRERGPSRRVSGARWALVERELSASETALRDQDVSWFARRLPESQLWRLYPTFRHRTAFLDIETTSLSPHDGIVTVVTVHGGGQTRTFVADDDLEELPAFLQRYDLLVTFNGKLFDVPFLETRFPGLRSPRPTWTSASFCTGWAFPVGSNASSRSSVSETARASKASTVEMPSACGPSSEGGIRPPSRPSFATTARIL